MADYQAGRNKGSTGSLGLGMGGAKIGGGLFNQNQQSTSTAGTGLFNQNKQLGKTPRLCKNFEDMILTVSWINFRIEIFMGIQKLHEIQSNSCFYIMTCVHAQ